MKMLPPYIGQTLSPEDFSWVRRKGKTPQTTQGETMSKKLTAKSLLKEVRTLKKLVAKDYSTIFDQLSTGKKIQMALKTYGMLSGQGLFDGELHEWVVDRSSYSKKWGVESKVLIPVIDGVPRKPRNPMNTVKIMRRSNGNVSVALGDMATSLIDIQL